MWILVVGPKDKLERPEGGVAVLRDLGCGVRTADLFESFEPIVALPEGPAAVLVEALDEIDAGRAALQRIRAVAGLADIPVLIGVTVASLQRVVPDDGFDDLVLVPYVPAELYVRVRRAEARRSDYAGREEIKMGALRIDLAAHEVRVEGRVVTLTHQEFALLRFLAQHRGRVYSREQLLSRVWGVDYYGGSRTVDIHMRRLRAKLGGASHALMTVRGAGYKMKAP